MDAIKHKQLVVADICNTLYDSNTTFDFIKYCVDSGKITGHTLLYKISISRILPIFWFLAVLQKLSKIDYHKAIAVGMFRGRTVNEVDKWARAFYEEYLEKKMIGQTNAILKQYNTGNIILVSSTIEPVAKVIAEKLGIADYIATELQRKGDKYSGAIQFEMSGRKLEALKNKFASENLAIESVITDNFSDKELMCHSVHRFAVCYNQSHERFWKSIPGVTIVHVTMGDI